MSARDIMTANPTCCTPDSTAEQAAREMVAADCGCLPVVADMESRQIVGVVTDRDLASRCLADGRGPETRIGDVMSSNPSCCSPDSEADEVERVMADRQVRRVPIVDDQQRCVGIVAQADLARDEKDFDDHEVRDTIERISEPTSRHRG